MDLPAALVALIVVAIIAYIVTVVHAATTRTLGRQSEPFGPEERLLAWPKWLLGLVAVLLVIWLLYRVRGILLPFVLGAVLAYLLNPGVSRLERRGWSRHKAIAVVFGAFLAIFIGLIVLLVTVVADQATDLVTHYDKYARDVQDLLTRANSLIADLPENAQRMLTDTGNKIQAYGRSLLQSIPAFLSRSLSLLSLLIITPVVTYWVLRDYQRLGRKLIRMVPQQRRGATMEVLGEINTLVGSYLLGMLIMVVIVGAYAVIVLSIAQVKFAVLLGAMTGVLYLIPYIGFPLSMAIIALTMGVTGHGIMAIVIVIAALVTANIVCDYVVTPRVVGGRVGLHPLVVIFSLLAGAALLNVLGMLLAVPAAGAIKVVLLRFWPELFSQDPPETPPAAAEAASPPS